MNRWGHSLRKLLRSTEKWAAGTRREKRTEIFFQQEGKRGRFQVWRSDSERARLSWLCWTVQAKGNSVKPKESGGKYDHSYLCLLGLWPALSYLVHFALPLLVSLSSSISSCCPQACITPNTLLLDVRILHVPHLFISQAASRYLLVVWPTFGLHYSDLIHLPPRVWICEALVEI